MAKIDKPIEGPEPGADDIVELDALADAYLNNRDEIVVLQAIGKREEAVSITRRQLYKYASVMSSNQVLADMLNIDVITLKNRFQKELKMARAFARQKLAVRFYNLALYGSNPADRLFALKNWANMSDTGMSESLDDAAEGTEFIIRRPQLAALLPSRIDEDQEENRETVKFDPELINEKNSV